MVPDRLNIVVLAVTLQFMVPELVPLAPDVIDSQLLPDVMTAVQGIDPVMVFETLKEVVPDEQLTLCIDGLTERICTLS